MDVTIVIRTKNEEEFIGETLKRIKNQDFGGKYEVIVVDSESTDSTVDIIKRQNVKLIQITQKEFSYGRALNIGTNEASGRFVVNLSAHCLPRDSKWLANLISGFEDNNTAATYGRQLSDGHVNPFEALRNDMFFGQEKASFNLKNQNTLKQIHFSNSNCAIRKSVWKSFKFDEQAPWAEDILWQKAVIEAGFSIVYAPDAAVYHTHAVDIYGAYKISKDCALTLALMDHKKRSIPMVLYDLWIFLISAPNSMYLDFKYILQNRYIQHLKIAPLHVMSGWLGWLVGRISYRVGKL